MVDAALKLLILNIEFPQKIIRRPIFRIKVEGFLVALDSALDIVAFQLLFTQLHHRQTQDGSIGSLTGCRLNILTDDNNGQQHQL